MIGRVWSGVRPRCSARCLRAAGTTIRAKTSRSAGAIIKVDPLNAMDTRWASKARPLRPLAPSSATETSTARPSALPIWCGGAPMVTGAGHQQAPLPLQVGALGPGDRIGCCWIAGQRYLPTPDCVPKDRGQRVQALDHRRRRILRRLAVGEALHLRIGKHRELECSKLLVIQDRRNVALTVLPCAPAQAAVLHSFVDIALNQIDHGQLIQRAPVHEVATAGLDGPIFEPLLRRFITSMNLRLPFPLDKLAGAVANGADAGHARCQRLACVRVYRVRNRLDPGYAMHPLRRALATDWPRNSR